MVVQSLIDIWQMILEIGGPFIIPVGFFFAGVIGYLVLLYLGRAGIANTENNANGDITARQRQQEPITEMNNNGDNIDTTESVHADGRVDESTTKDD
ncbi:hypothetical protein [Haloquadratum walsbyi]|jgi:hypothetical protein|uniref:Uncharacterized protein n=1 Tax=Haloquadratum walsbyi J07HQW2 TaxID=1238425 RepID=U1NJ39_9EURY|nr:hypothetical protein [Haloquadratum walsbyi]ERG96933.1 MAG: hypothetical protein J07HQW2_03417 [Haloquadratum walsbyi J07HQW2]